MISKSNIAAINKVRTLLRSLEHKTIEYDGNGAQGRFAEACRAAEEALANVLIIAQIWLKEKVSAADVHGDDDI